MDLNNDLMNIQYDVYSFILALRLKFILASPIKVENYIEKYNCVFNKI
jgi:hypothetical protein